MERITLEEAAEMIGVNRESLAKWIAEGEIKIGRRIRIGKRATYLIYRENVEKFLKMED